MLKKQFMHYLLMVATVLVVSLPAQAGMVDMEEQEPAEVLEDMVEATEEAASKTMAGAERLEAMADTVAEADMAAAVAVDHQLVFCSPDHPIYHTPPAIPIHWVMAALEEPARVTTAPLGKK